jgi:hypothetical protein
MRYDDRITSVEISDAEYTTPWQELFALLNDADVRADLDAEEYQCPSEYDDQEWLDKNNY